MQWISEVTASYLGRVETGGGVTEQSSKESKRADGGEKEEVEGGGGTKEQNPEGGTNDPRCGRVPPPPAPAITGSASRKPRDVTQTLVTPC